ncbi:MAG: hypothetical protein IIA09_08690 [Proteobacteria bacterium]|nr:hypothetical protein [Pseudomonadota bacterium]
MSADISTIKAGLAIVLIGLFFSVGLGISFGVNEDAYQEYVAEGIAAHPELHNASSADKIWRYALRTHFHAGGIAAFCLGLIILVMFSDLSRRLKNISSISIGLGSVYPLAWLSMFFLAPSIGRGAAHEHILTKLFTFIGVAGLLLGSFILVANLFFGFFREHREA